MHKQEPISTMSPKPEMEGKPIREFMDDLKKDVEEQIEAGSSPYPNLIQFVKDECQRLPYYPDDPDADLDNWFNQQIQKAFPEIVETMSKYDLLGNGIAVQIMMDRLQRLVMWKPISPIEIYESDPSLWCDCPADEDGTMQSRRCPALFYYPKEQKYRYVEHAYYNEKDPVDRKYDSQYTGALFTDKTKNLFYPYLKKMGLLEKQSTCLDDVRMPFYPPDKSVKIDVSLEELDLLATLEFMANAFEEWKEHTAPEDRVVKNHGMAGMAIKIDMIRPEVTIFEKRNSAVIKLNMYRYDPNCGNRPDLITSVTRWVNDIYVPEDHPGYLATYVQNATTSLLRHIKTMAKMANCYKLPCFVVKMPLGEASKMGLDIKIGWMLEANTYDHNNSDLMVFCHNECTWVAFGDNLDIEPYTMALMRSDEDLMFNKSAREWCDYYLKVDEYRKAKYERVHDAMVCALEVEPNDT